MESSYRGWDKDKMQETGSNWREQSIPNFPSFAPVNPRRVQTPTITPQRTLLAKGLDSDFLYELQEDTPEVTSRQSRKRSNASTSRKISSANGGEYEDGGDIKYQNNSANLEESDAKRKKIPITKPSPSLETPVLVMKQSWKNVGDDQYFQQEALRSQVSTPPKSGKRSKSMASSKGNPKLKKPFQNTKTTKPLSVRGKEVAPGSGPPMSYHGFTTTEEAVFLSKTTLKNLAAFRYKPSTVSTLPLKPIPVDHLTELEEPPLFENQQTTEAPLLDDKTTPNSVSVFKEATWHARDDVIHHKSDGVGHNDCSYSGLATEKRYSHMGHPLSQPVHAVFQQVSCPFEAYRHFPASPTGDMHKNPVQTSQHFRYEDGFDDPTSSEDLLLDNLLEGVGENLGTYKSLEYEEAVCSAIASDRNKDSLALLETEDLTNLKTMINSGGRIEIERSDLEENKLKPDASRHFYGTDEFDEGLDDQDLIAVISDVIIPENPSQPNSSHGDHIRRLRVSSSPAQDERIHTANNRNDIAARICLSKKTTPTPRIFYSDPADDYFMNEQDEDEMLKLCGFYQNVVENFIPPASVQGGISNNNDSKTEEHDSCLLFSPATSPAETAVGTNTDSHSASQSPQGQSNVDIPNVLEEEDWSFMHANYELQDRAALIMPDTFTEPPSAVPKRQIIDITSSSPMKRTVSISSKAQTNTTQITTTSAYTVLDFDDSHEYEPIATPFVRPPFVALILDRSPVIGLSSQRFLRPCFRIGEMFHAGVKYNALGPDACIELFARVNYSHREPGTTKQHFQFLDLWVDRPPTPNGVLASFKTSGLAESESRVFIGCKEKKLARVLGNLQRDPKRRDSPWLLDIISIRETDWEEIRWTRRIVSGDDLVKKERDLRTSKL